MAELPSILNTRDAAQTYWSVSRRGSKFAAQLTASGSQAPSGISTGVPK